MQETGKFVRRQLSITHLLPRCTLLLRHKPLRNTLTGVSAAIGRKGWAGEYLSAFTGETALQPVTEHWQRKAYSPSTVRTYKNEAGIFLQTVKNKQADTLTSQDMRK